MKSFPPEHWTSFMQGSRDAGLVVFFWGGGGLVFGPQLENRTHAQSSR